MTPEPRSLEEQHAMAKKIMDMHGPAMWVWEYQEGRHFVLELKGFHSTRPIGKHDYPYDIEIGTYYVPMHNMEPISERFWPPPELLKHNMACDLFIQLTEEGKMVPLYPDEAPWNL